MRRFILYILIGVLCGLILARTLTPEPETSAAAYGYNVLDTDAGQPPETALSSAAYGYNALDTAADDPPETAGSAVIDGLRAYFLSRTPTAKNAMTGAAAGKSLIVLLAESWTPDAAPARKNPAFARFARQAAKVGDVYRPDWGQGLDGPAFALLTGLIPAPIGDDTALAVTGRENVYLPYALANAFAAAGAATYAFAPPDMPYPAWAALGFAHTVVCPGTAAQTGDVAAAICLDDDAPFFAFCVLADGDADDGLRAIMDALDDTGRADDTVVCLSVAAEGSLRGGLYLWGVPVPNAAADIPCSEPDVAPTLLNLFGLPYDARVLSGRDIFASNGLDGTVSAAMPLVPLTAEPSCDWITRRGGYLASQSLFWPYDDGFADEAAITDYVRQVSAEAAARRDAARRILETDYFRLTPGDG